MNLRRLVLIVAMSYLHGVTDYLLHGATQSNPVFGLAFFVAATGFSTALTRLIRRPETAVAVPK
jgi:1-aminocyclopropane-1-carboxylate deaminase/D-cysteine desulfhydrase-like pyridoxal-dependent ACC family enzyme